MRRLPPRTRSVTRAITGRGLPPREGGPTLGDERATLVEYLRCQRLTLEMKCSGLDAAALARRSVPPSTLSLLGLVRHLGEVERSWSGGSTDQGQVSLREVLVHMIEKYARHTATPTCCASGSTAGPPMTVGRRGPRGTRRVTRACTSPSHRITACVCRGPHTSVAGVGSSVGQETEDFQAVRLPADVAELHTDAVDRTGQDSRPRRRPADAHLFWATVVPSADDARGHRSLGGCRPGRLTARTEDDPVTVRRSPVARTKDDPVAVDEQRERAAT